MERVCYRFVTGNLSLTYIFRNIFPY